MKNMCTWFKNSTPERTIQIIWFLVSSLLSYHILCFVLYSKLSIIYLNSCLSVCLSEHLSIYHLSISSPEGVWAAPWREGHGEGRPDRRKGGQGMVNLFKASNEFEDHLCDRFGLMACRWVLRIRLSTGVKYQRKLLIGLS